jgi:hypothetical protein
LFATTALVIAALACGGGGGSEEPTATPAPQIDTAGTAAALQSTAEALAAAQTEQAQVPPTTVQLPTVEVVNTEPPPPPTEAQASGPQTYVDDFSEDRDNFEIFDDGNGSAQISDGVLLLGPFTNCGDLEGAAFGCFTTCLACGLVTEYDMQVDAAYISGVSDRTFGMALRFIDNNGNGYVDSDDYFLDFELSVYDQFFAVYEHGTDGQWRTLDQRQESNIKSGSQINNLRAHSYNGGTSLDLYLNGTQVETITLSESYTTGYVGLVVGFRAMQAGFDNFQITLP